MEEVIIPQEYKYITAFLTMRCNLACDFCLNSFDEGFDRRGFEEISGEQWVESLNRIKTRKGVPITLSGGEPFMHLDFIDIINGVRSETEIDILTNLMWGNKGIERFIGEVNPKRVRRDSPYASIRASYHPGEMGDEAELVENAKRLQEAGFSVGIWAVLYPSPEQLSKITQMQFRCREKDIDFRVKEFTGVYEGKVYGDYSKYPGASFGGEKKDCLCKTSELLIGPNADVYKCHRDVYAGEFSVGNLTDLNFQISTEFLDCDNYGDCHPCDVKVKTDHKQKLGHTSVEIKFPDESS